ncbi:hypothetical protein N8508_00265 [bacterium]|nr:hypothetical protein [bacterium]
MEETNIEKMQKQVVEDKHFPPLVFNQRIGFGKYGSVTIGSITDLPYLEWVVEILPLKKSAVVAEQIKILKEVKNEGTI